MEDIIQKYKKKKKIQSLGIIITSLALAIGLNVFVSNTDSGKYIKASVLNSNIGVEKKSDLYLENIKSSGNLIVNLKSSKEILKAKSISFSLVYNKDNVILKSKKANFDGVELLNLVDNDGYNTIILNFKNPTNIKAGDNIVNIILEKKENKQENLNLVNSNITDSDNNLFVLSTSGVDF
ncbi:MAG: hypothetical protein PHE25_05820 [Candidatus Gracilibacteria bacterium]|nr:hypothetical protein [Candidatus Gracilibacteria bacterium]